MKFLTAFFYCSNDLFRLFFIKQINYLEDKFFIFFYKKDDLHVIIIDIDIFSYWYFYRKKIFTRGINRINCLTK